MNVHQGQIIKSVIVHSGFLLKHIKVSAGKQATVNFQVSLQKRGGQNILLSPSSFKRGGRRPLVPPPGSAPDPIQAISNKQKTFSLQQKLFATTFDIHLCILLKSNNLSFKFPRLAPSGYKDVGIRKFQIVTRVQFLYRKLLVGFYDLKFPQITIYDTCVQSFVVGNYLKFLSYENLPWGYVKSHTKIWARSVHPF